MEGTGRDIADFAEVVATLILGRTPTAVRVDDAEGTGGGAIAPRVPDGRGAIEARPAKAVRSTARETRGLASESREVAPFSTTDGREARLEVELDLLGLEVVEVKGEGRLASGRLYPSRFSGDGVACLTVLAERLLFTEETLVIDIVRA